MKRKLKRELKQIKHMKESGKDLVFIGNSSQPGQHSIRAKRNQILVLCPNNRLERNNYGTDTITAVILRYFTRNLRHAKART